MNFFSQRKLMAKVFIFMLVAAAVVVMANQDGPPNGYTGSMGQLDCSICHSDFAVGSGLDLGGMFEIMGVPDQYTPGQTYQITVTIGQPGQTRWGFELAARFEGTEDQAGTIVQTDLDNTQLSTFRNVQYIKHTNQGTYEMTADGPVSWSFNWIAPDTGTVVFGAAGNAANDDNTPSGDYIYVKEVTTTAVE